MTERLEVRAATRADLSALAAIAREAFDAGELGDVGRGEIDGFLARQGSDPGPTLVAELEGVVAGWLEPPMELLVVAREHRRRGVGRALVAAGEREVAARGDGPLELAPPTGSSGANAFLRAVGYAPRSSLFEMILPAHVSVEAPRIDAPFVDRPYRPGSDDERYVSLVNASFADHASPIQVTLPLIREAHARAGWTTANVRVVALHAEPDRLVAFARVEPVDGPGTHDEIRLIGVLPDWRGQGLGRELLRWGVQELRSRGAGEIALTVHAWNERALGLYARHGFVRRREWPRWARAGA